MKLKNLPSGQYEKISTTYIPLIEGQGACCDNCGRLIANIVRVKHEGGEYYTIGQDCAKTLFTDVVNKQIDVEIKEEKRRQDKAKKAAERLKHREAFAELMEAERSAGITNSNINTDWAKCKFNELLATLEAKHGFYISYPRH